MSSLIFSKLFAFKIGVGPSAPRTDLAADTIFEIDRFSPVDEQIKIVAIDKWGNRSKPSIIDIKINKQKKVLVKKLERLDPRINKIDSKQLKKMPDFSAGDTVVVSVKVKEGKRENKAEANVQWGHVPSSRSSVLRGAPEVRHRRGALHGLPRAAVLEQPSCSALTLPRAPLGASPSH